MPSAARVLTRVATPLARRVPAAGGSVVGIRTGEPHVVMTFDDGPDPTGTRAVLRALSEHDATATFFILLTRARRNPAMLAELLAAGHEIALHGVDHARPTTFSAAEARRRLVEGRAELEELSGQQVRWYRPPYGAQTLSTWRATRAAGLTPVMWGGTTWDWRDVAQDDRVAKALSTAAKPGAILLGHDCFAGPEDNAPPGDPEPQLDRHDLIDRILTGLADQGLVGRSLADALESGTPESAAWFTPAG